MRIVKREELYLQSNHKEQTSYPLHSARYNNPNLTHNLEIGQIVKLRSLSVHLKRLRWNDLLHKRFWRKYKLIRPCISQVSRQLLNYELKKKKTLLLNGNRPSSLKNTKSIILNDKEPDKFQLLQNINCQSLSERKEMKRKSCEVLSSEKASGTTMCTIESPIKKMKQKDTEKDSEGNFFVGFESSTSPSRALIKLRTVNLKNLKTSSPFLSKPGISIVTKDGVHSIKTKAVVLSNAKPSCIYPSKLENGDVSTLLSEEKPSNLEDIPEVDKTVKSDSISCVNSEIICKELNKCEYDPFNTDSSKSLNEKPISLHSLESETTTDKVFVSTSAATAINKDVIKNKTDIMTSVNCVARKRTFKFELKNCTKTNSHLVNSLSSQQNVKLKFNNSDGTISPTHPVEYQSDSSNDDSSETLSVRHDSSEDENKIKPFTYLKTPTSSLTTPKYTSSKKNLEEFSDSDSTSLDTLSDVSSSALCDSSSSDEEPEEDAHSYVEMEKFLACQIDAFNSENGKEDDSVTYSSQNYQLKCESQVLVRLLTATDITDKFCLKHKVTGICGFKLKQLLCTLKHEPRNGYDSTAQPEIEEEEEEIIKTPHFLTIPDPLTHSLFSTIIRRDRKEKKSSNMKLIEIINRALLVIDPKAIIRRPLNHIIHPIKPSLNSEKPRIFVRKESTLTAGFVRPISTVPQNVYSPITNSSSIPSGSPMMFSYVSSNSLSPIVSPNLMSGGNYILLPRIGGTSGTFILPRAPTTVGSAIPQPTVYSTTTQGFSPAPTVYPTNTQEFSPAPTVNSINAQGFLSAPIVNSTNAQGFPAAPPPLTPCSNLVRFTGQGPFSISQPPQLKRMNNLQSTPTIDLTDESSNPEPVSEPQMIRPMNAFSNYLRYEETTVTCPNHPLTIQKLNEKLFKITEIIKAFLCIGFERNEECILNASFQMLYSDNEICCKFHAISALNKFGIFRHVNLTPYYRQSNFLELPLPQPPIFDGYSTFTPNHDLLIVKRFVFAVDKTTRAILFPLPPYCIPKENDMVDKITVVFFISPRRGMGPGLIVFPHSILQRRLLLSLETPNSSNPLGRDWVISAHQRGGLTQSMLTEFLDEATPWVDNLALGSNPVLVVDWWWCLDNDSLNYRFKSFNQVQLQLMYARNKDPFEICLGVTLDRMWGNLVRKFNTTVGALKEDNFPKFIVQVMKDLCSPSRITAWCKSSGLYPINSTRANLFSKSFENVRI